MPLRIEFDMLGTRDDETIEEAIIRHAASRVLEHSDRQALRDKVMDLIDERLAPKVDEMVERALSDIIQPTDQFGKPNAPPISLREHMIEFMQSYLDEQVDKSGNKVDSCGYGRTGTKRVEWITSKVAHQVWDSQMEKNVNSVVSNIRTELQDKMIKHYAAKLREMFGLP